MGHICPMGRSRVKAKILKKFDSKTHQMAPFPKIFSVERMPTNPLPRGLRIAQLAEHKLTPPPLLANHAPCTCIMLMVNLSRTHKK